MKPIKAAEHWWGFSNSQKNTTSVSFIKKLLELPGSRMINVFQSSSLPVFQSSNEVLREIQMCEHVASFCPYGLIVNDALQIPNMGIVLSEQVKFDMTHVGCYSALALHDVEIFSDVLECFNDVSSLIGHLGMSS
jgi:hypothetical protein